MKTGSHLFFFLIVCGVASGYATAALGAVVAPPPNLNAKSFLLVDFDSGNTLAEKSSDMPFEPASLTKLMAAYVVDAEIQAGRLQRDEKVVISDQAARMGFARSGMQVSVEELLKIVIVRSTNGATLALAEHIGGSEIAFATLMNQYAHRLGMTRSHFTNSTGLSAPNHSMTARDLATLARAIIRDFPESYAWYALKEYTSNGVTLTSRNKLLWIDPAVDGLKTGYAEGAGFSLVASAKKNGMRLISVVLGSSSEQARTDESHSLLNYGFIAFETHRLYLGQQPLAETLVWKGEKKKLALGLMSDLYITIPRGQQKNLNASLDLSKRIIAPADKGQPFGSVKVKLGDRLYAEQSLVSLEPVAAGGFVSNVVDDVKLLFE